MTLFYPKHGFRLLITLGALLTILSTQAADAPDPGMKKSQVSKLAKLYIRAIERQNFEAWRDLLSPLHPHAEELNEETFLEQTQSIKSISMENIDGLNVALQIKYNSDRLQAGTLLLHSSGRIKYTPLCFRHPLHTVCAKLEPLLDDRVTMFGSSTSAASRMNAVHELQGLRVPVVDYDPLAPTNEERQTAARKILEWLEENGQQYDTTKPNVFIPPHEFDALMERLRNAAGPTRGM